MLLAYFNLLIFAFCCSLNPIYGFHSIDDPRAGIRGLEHSTKSSPITSNAQKYDSKDAAAAFVPGSQEYHGLARARSIFVTPNKPLQALNLKARTKTALIKRTNNIQLAYYKPYQFLIPTSAAGPLMRDFFASVAVEAIINWPRTRSQSALFTVTQGPFQMTVSCLGATIPWDVLASSARRFSQSASAMYACTFDAIYKEAGTSITLWISLRLLDDFSHRPPRLAQPASRNPQRRNLAGPNPAIERRLPPNNIPPNTSLSMTKLRTFTALLPVAIAAQKLVDFYEIIALKIETGQYDHIAPSKNLIINRWDFELSFSSDSIAIPFSFVQSFVIDMARQSSMQFTGFYEATFRGEGALSGLIILVKMGLKDGPLRPLGGVLP